MHFEGQKSKGGKKKNVDRYNDFSMKQPKRTLEIGDKIVIKDKT